MVEAVGAQNRPRRPLPSRPARWPLPRPRPGSTCPMLVRVFSKVEGHHTFEDFAVRGKEPEDEVQIYTWKDATLRELTDLVKEVYPAAKGDAILSFAFVYSDKNGRFVVRPVRTTSSYGKLDEGKAPAELKFQVGDYLDAAIL